jgi:phospholipase/lecithinase/hemolysin
MRPLLKLNRLASRLISPFNLDSLPNEPGAGISDVDKTPTWRPRGLHLGAALVFMLVAAAASAQQYTSIVVFGDSLSDTGNVSDLTQEKYGFRFPGNGPFFPADYTDGRFTDGLDTVPAANNYLGVWIEQLAATFPAKPPVKASLDGGKNYGYGFAFTGNGTADLVFDAADGLSVNVNNIGLQITDYLATKPTIDHKTLFVVWGGANDLLNATSNKDIIDAAVDQAINIQRLIDAGASQFIVPNLPNLGAVPRFNGSPTTSIPAMKATVLYNTVLAAAVNIVRLANPGKRIIQFDVYGLITQILASPSKFGLVNVTGSARGNPTVNPDTFLFWDDLHPTTRGHNILAEAARSLLVPCQSWDPAECEVFAVAGVQK